MIYTDFCIFNEVKKGKRPFKVYFAYIFITALIRPSMAPAVPNPLGFNKEFMFKVLFSLVPPLVLIFLVLGSIIMGIATVNQAGAIGAIGATIMAGYKLFEDRKGALFPSALARFLGLCKLSVFLLVIILLSRFFELVFKGIYSPGTFQDVIPDLIL